MATNPEQTIIPTVHSLTSSKSICTVFALEELAGANGTKYNIKRISRKEGPPYAALKEHFLLGKSPTVTLENINGDPPQTYQLKPGVLTETRLVLQFIADNYSDGIWEPQSNEDRLRNNFFQEFSNSTLLEKIDFALLFETIAQMLPFPFKQVVGALFTPIINHFKKDHADIFQVMEDYLSEQKPWFAGEKIGLADFNLTFPMDIAQQRGYFPAAKYPKIAKWQEALHDRPAYKRAVENVGVYDLKKWA
jgi:glutathione S-transferase